RRNVGMVFQQYNLWPHLTVQQNLIFTQPQYTAGRFNQVLLHGQMRRNVGMVFQQYNLWPHLTVQQNLIF
ncbi:hypothetical protein PSY22_23580, partial [Shigella flexneri]|nr:hypothetical protein [Shigella flexneri]